MDPPEPRALPGVLVYKGLSALRECGCLKDRRSDSYQPSLEGWGTGERIHPTLNGLLLLTPINCGQTSG